MTNMLISGTTCRTGVGEEFVKKVSLSDEYSIICLVRKTSEISWIKKLANVKISFGDLNDQEFLIRQLRKVDLIVHIAGIKLALNILNAMKISGVKQGIFVNTTGVFSKFRLASEEYKVIESKMFQILFEERIKFVIVRPTMIYGNGKDNNVRKIVLYLKNHNVFPLFNGGNSLVQPVYYKDISNALIRLLKNKRCWGKSFNLPGKEPLTYKNFIEIIAEAIGKRVKFIHLPVYPTAEIAEILHKLIPSFPLNKERILRTTEDRAFDYKEAKECFGYSPLSFREGIKLEIEELKRNGLL